MKHEFLEGEIYAMAGPGEVIALPFLDCTLDVDEIYRNVDSAA